MAFFVRCDKIEAGLQFEVSDTGIGMDANEQSVIFDRFMQAGLTDMRVGQGAGLGLSITKAFVEVLGGEINVTSTVDKGTTFTFTLPCKCVEISELSL